MKYRQTYSQHQQSIFLEREADRLLRNAEPRQKKSTSNYGITKSAVLAGCDCDVLPWEDCEHTEAAANAAMIDMLAPH